MTNPPNLLFKTINGKVITITMKPEVLIFDMGDVKIFAQDAYPNTRESIITLEYSGEELARIKAPLDEITKVNEFLFNTNPNY